VTGAPLVAGTVALALSSTMPRARDELTAGEWAVLALLREHSAHGFALARAMAPEGEVGRVWALRRPLVYRALVMLERMGLVRPVGILPSPSGPQRTLVEATPAGERELTRWLGEPVSHVRDARSLLMLKLLFIDRRKADPERLLVAQRIRFLMLAENLSMAADAARGFDRALLLWRLESTTAAVRFTEAMLAERASGSEAGGSGPGRLGRRSDMNNDEPKPRVKDAPERADDRSNASSTPPRGNPETDHESVEKGKEQLGKVSGN
jgi:DNA-binding PadR family transcriptional regulator